ncbi:Uncharacterised protein [Citrobacter koseri]|uniref:Uncharacterized protein n=1 Tax=Citrobacter koseri TaxID=545 RepID=A0A2X2X7H5_CITKO|nr:Uncharacterised protein [Citrobacter koseri]
MVLFICVMNRLQLRELLQVAVIGGLITRVHFFGFGVDVALAVCRSVSWRPFNKPVLVFRYLSSDLSIALISPLFPLKKSATDWRI